MYVPELASQSVHLVLIFNPCQVNYTSDDTDTYILIPWQ